MKYRPGSFSSPSEKIKNVTDSLMSSLYKDIDTIAPPVQKIVLRDYSFLYDVLGFVVFGLNIAGFLFVYWWNSQQILLYEKNRLGFAHIEHAALVIGHDVVGSLLLFFLGLPGMFAFLFLFFFPIWILFDYVLAFVFPSFYAYYSARNAQGGYHKPLYVLQAFVDLHDVEELALYTRRLLGIIAAIFMALVGINSFLYQWLGYL